MPWSSVILPAALALAYVSVLQCAIMHCDALRSHRSPRTGGLAPQCQEPRAQASWPSRAPTLAQAEYEHRGASLRLAALCLRFHSQTVAAGEPPSPSPSMNIADISFIPLASDLPVGKALKPPPAERAHSSSCLGTLLPCPEPPFLDRLDFVNGRRPDLVLTPPMLQARQSLRAVQASKARAAARPFHAGGIRRPRRQERPPPDVKAR